MEPARELRDETMLRDWCNLGYARKKCPRFPENSGPDAVRFSAVSETDSGLKLYYVVEKDHAPLEHGPMEYSIRQQQFLQGHSSELLLHQAQAYVQSYLLRKTQPQDQAKHPHRR